jgi:ABC-type oligopeptide transport system substrate-binding subunit
MSKKRFMSLLFCAVLALSCLSCTVSAANTSDSIYTYTWNSNSRIDYTNARKKQNATKVYIHAVENTLPYNGFYASTYYGTGLYTATNKASASEYKINSYGHFVIRPNGTSVNQSGKYVRIRGHYTDTKYSWGDAQIAWSPDTAPQSGLINLN